MGRRIAVLIGNQTFEESSKLRNLRGPANDVQTLTQVLTDPGLGGFDVQAFVDSDSRSILRHLAKVMKDARIDDTILIYYAGHGLLDDGGHLHLATRDTDEFMRATSIPAIHMWHVCQGGTYPNLILILDCCFAGAFTEGIRASQEAVPLAQLPHARGFHFLAGSSPVARALEQDMEGIGVCGQFTHELIQGIKTGAADADQDGMVSLPELSRYLARQLGPDKTRYEAHRTDGAPPFISRVPLTPTLRQQRLARISGWYDEGAIDPAVYGLLEDAIEEDEPSNRAKRLLGLMDHPTTRPIHVIRYLERNESTHPVAAAAPAPANHGRSPASHDASEPARPVAVPPPRVAPAAPTTLRAGASPGTVAPRPQRPVWSVGKILLALFLATGLGTAGAIGIIWAVLHNSYKEDAAIAQAAADAAAAAAEAQAAADAAATAAEAQAAADAAATAADAAASTPVDTSATAEQDAMAAMAAVEAASAAADAAAAAAIAATAEIPDVSADVPLENSETTPAEVIVEEPD